YRACVGRGVSGVRRLNEAHLVAGIVRDLVAAGTPVTDPDTGAERPLRYGDVAVLARGNAPFETFAAVLPSLGVPAVEVAGGDLRRPARARRRGAARARGPRPPPPPAAPPPPARRAAGGGARGGGRGGRARAGPPPPGRRRGRRGRGRAGGGSAP